MFSREEKTPLAEWWRSVDRELLGALALLLASGFVLSFAASPPVAERVGLPPWHFVVRHASFCALALLVMIATSMLTHRQARLWALIMLVVSLVLLWVTPVMGEEVKGARRWLSIGGFSVQPSEFAKPAFAAIGAWLFAETIRRPDVPGRLLAFVLVIMIAAGLLLQPDIGQTALVLATWAALMFLSGISWWTVLGLGVLGGGLVVGAYLAFPHFARRINAFIDPEASGNTYQIDRAMEAFVEGGWFGLGPGESLAKKRIPDAHADYVFAAAAGEFGIIFCLWLAGLIGFIALKAMIVAQSQSDLVARLAASTIAAQFAMQSGIHLTVNTNLLPTKGMTLPFVSYGGTSMIATAFGMGLMLAFTRIRSQERLPSALGGMIRPR
jgi:cell division protein FtsW